MNSQNTDKSKTSPVASNHAKSLFGNKKDLANYVTSPLALFALVVTVCNSIMVIAAANLESVPAFILTVHMFMGIVGAFVLVALWSPHSLYGLKDLKALEDNNYEFPDNYLGKIVVTLVLMVCLLIYIGYRDKTDNKQPTSFAVATAEIDGKLIQRTYDAWAKATQEKDIKQWALFLAEDPYFSPADAPPLNNRQAILDYYERSFSDPNFILVCEQQEIHVAELGDMAWSRGVCTGAYSGTDGKPVSNSSRWFKIWAKQTDGSWKGRVNSWKLDN